MNIVINKVCIQTRRIVLLLKAWKTKLNQENCLGTYIITAVRNNGTNRTREGRDKDTSNMRNLSPYK